MAEPWIRVHANLPSKPVVMRAVEALGVSSHEAIGLLVQFWGAVSQYVTDGLVGDHTDAQLEVWAGWKRKRGRFAAFVRTHHLDDDGRVNEWEEYAGALEEQRRQSRTRQQKNRDRKRDGHTEKRDSHRDGHSDNGVTSSPTIRDDTKRDEEPSPPPASAGVSVWRPVLESALAARLPSDHARNALAVVLLKAPNRLAWVAELNAMLERMAGHVPATGDDLESAMTEFIADGKAESEPKLALFKRYVERVVQRPDSQRGMPSVDRKPSGHGGNGASGRAALMLGKIRQLIRETQAPGQALRRSIPKHDVAELGADVFEAYVAIGGADRILAATGEQFGFVLRDFTQALEATHAAHV